MKITNAEPAVEESAPPELLPCGGSGGKGDGAAVDAGAEFEVLVPCGSASAGMHARAEFPTSCNEFCAALSVGLTPRPDPRADSELENAAPKCCPSPAIGLTPRPNPRADIAGKTAVTGAAAGLSYCAARPSETKAESSLKVLGVVCHVC